MYKKAAMLLGFHLLPTLYIKADIDLEFS